MSIRFAKGKSFGALTILLVTDRFQGTERIFLVRCACGWQGELRRVAIINQLACADCQQQRLKEHQRRRHSAPRFLTQRGRTLFNLIVNARVETCRNLGVPFDQKDLLLVYVEAAEEVHRIESSTDEAAWREALAYWLPKRRQSSLVNTSATGLCVAEGGGIPSTW